MVPVCMAGKEHARVRMTSFIRFFYFMGMPQRVRVRSQIYERKAGTIPPFFAKVCVLRARFDLIGSDRRSKYLF